MPDPWPIIVVTGANSGVGFGICHRFLVQLSERVPPDALLNLSGVPQNLESRKGYDGLTLIMACRNLKLAEIARTKLYKLLDVHILQLKRAPAYDGHADSFRRNLQIDIHHVDLAVVDSVLQFSRIIRIKYPYVSHLICNAGVASFCGIDWIMAVKQMCREPIIAVTAPLFNLQNSGERSVDGLGWVWQCNVFCHYLLYRTLEAKFAACPMPPRVVWISSSEARPGFADPEDWQLVKTQHSYEASKYQMDLLGTQLNRQPHSHSIVRHFVVMPGVVSTNIGVALVGAFMEIMKVVVFYLARFLGSTQHTIKPYKAAVSAVQVSLVPLSHVSVPDGEPVKYGSETVRWGDEYTNVTRVIDWESHSEESSRLLERCEHLCAKYRPQDDAT